MDYTFLSEEDKKQAMGNRLAQLEQEHYSATLYLEEAKLLNLPTEVDKYAAQIDALEPRIAEYKKRLSE